MRGVGIGLEVSVRSIAALALPPNTERIAASYVGDLCFSLVRDPRNRMLFLSSPWGFHSLDPSHLLASYATALREWDREQGWIHGQSPDRVAGARPVSRGRQTRRRRPHSTAVRADGKQAKSVRRVAAAHRRTDGDGRPRRRRRDRAV